MTPCDDVSLEMKLWHPNNECWPIDMFRQATGYPCTSLERVKVDSRDGLSREALLGDLLN